MITQVQVRMVRPSRLLSFNHKVLFRGVLRSTWDELTSQSHRFFCFLSLSPHSRGIPIISNHLQEGWPAIEGRNPMEKLNTFLKFSFSNPVHVLLCLGLAYFCWKELKILGRGESGNRQPKLLPKTNNALFYWLLPLVMAHGVLTCHDLSRENFFAIHVIIGIIYIANAGVVAVYCGLSGRWRCFPDILLGAVRPNLFLYLLVAPMVIGSDCNGAEFSIESIMSTLLTAIVLSVFAQKGSSLIRIFRQLVFIPVIIAIAVASFWKWIILPWWLSVGLPDPSLQLATIIGWPASWCTPISIIVVLVTLTSTWKKITFATLGPTALVVILSLWVVPSMCYGLCEQAVQWGCLGKSSADKLTLLFAMACSTSAFVMIQKIKGEAIAYVNFVFIVTLVSPVSVYFFVKTYF